MSVFQVGTIRNFSKEEIKAEPQLYRASIDFALQQLGKGIGDMVDLIEGQGTELFWDNCYVDVRTNMLKPTWWPSIPGWHCDAVPRDPDTKKILENHPKRDAIKHWILLLDSGSNSLTEFIDPSTPYTPVDAEGYNESYWAVQSKTINTMIKAGELKTFYAKPNTVYEFDAYDYHRATQATGHGYRCFIRISYVPNCKWENEVRFQTQSYIPLEDEGW